MTRPGLPGRLARARELPIAGLPRPLLSFVLLVDVCVAVWFGALVARSRPDLHEVGLFALILGTALAFEYGASRFGRLQWRLSTELKRDMSSVWVVAGAIALDAAPAAILVVVIFTQIWLRQHRQSGQPLYRIWFATSAAVAGCLAAGAAARAVDAATIDLPLALGTSLPVVVAILVYAAVDRAFITVALVGVGARGRDLAGSKDDNLAELATLCLGGLVAVGVTVQPWLCLLALIPMSVMQRSALVHELESAAITDAKTKLLNAIAWEQLARRELLRAERTGQQASVLIIDIDRFKTVNDRFGHLAGDKVLAGVARCVKESLRGYDGLGRFGGEEFVAVLPESGEHDSLVIAERIRLRVNQVCIKDFIPELDDESNHGAERLSVSIGVAVLKYDGAELPELLHAADQALYRAKWNGRNQVQLARRGDQIPDTVVF